MKFEQFIANKFLSKSRGSFSAPLIRIATYSIAMGVLVMLMSVCILKGFKRAISQKVVGFGSHIVVRNYELGNLYETYPISKDRPEVDLIRRTPGVKHVQFFANKGGMLKTDTQIHGVVFKGVDNQFDRSFFSENMVEGRMFQFSDGSASTEVIVSRTIANKLGYKLGDKARIYFWQENNYRARSFTIVGIYNTDLTEFDEHYIVGDLLQVQKLNGWNGSQVAGYEILVSDFARVDEIAGHIGEQLDYDLAYTTIVQENQALFSWLELLDSNIVLILVVMAMVCMVSIVSALLIMIFEKTSMIGVLKTLGSSNRSVRKIFLIKSAQIIAKGTLLGNTLALALCLLQLKFKIVHLDSASYSVNYVPIDLNVWIFLIVSIATVLICVLSLVIPTAYISHIKPAKTIRVE